MAISERALAALQTHKNPKAEMLEGFDPHLPRGAMEKGLWVNFKEAKLSNYAHVNPIAKQTNYGLPYRGSQVLLAYDKTKLSQSDVPKTWNTLTNWIKSNPGQFIYNRPDNGGSGGNFVRRAILEANGRDPKRFTIDNYSESYAKKTLPPAWTILRDLAPYLYGKGSYTAGNTQSIQLLAQGVVTMVPVWSDQVLQSLSQGGLPETTGLVQLDDLAFCGGMSQITVFTNGENKQATLKLSDFLLSSNIQSQIIEKIGGFPAISWEYIADDLREKYKDVVPKSIPTFPNGPWDNAINSGWYRNVVPNLKS
ncbi:MAG: hypothetical protein CENE_01144 [Candidatus Celerinatantimonas neptuna]|nr:MAG: hypothetical protein CENE_01144 [Candidatus Celerinatantimonas neptuna]